MQDRKDFFDDLFGVPDKYVLVTLAALAVAFLIYSACR